MKKIKELMPEAYDFNGKLSLKQAIPLGLQHVMAMFVGNLTPLLIITGACGIGAGSEYASIQVALLQNAMIIAGIVTLIQLFSIGSKLGSGGGTAWLLEARCLLLWVQALDLSEYSAV